MVITRMDAKAFRRMAEGRRGTAPDAGARRREMVVREIIRTVRDDGDKALVEYAARFDGVRLDQAELALTADEVAAGAAACPPEVMAALAAAAGNIEAFHRRQLPSSWWEQPVGAGGLLRGQVVRPLDSVGVYIPGGTAAYPSTVLMGAIPARVAGVRRVVICTPPTPRGSVPAPVLGAARLCGISEVYRVGGAQAVAALAYGTRTLLRVDKIVGPGNAYVTAAKRLVSGDVGIDMLAGPSEILIIADDRADPAHLAADLLAQAEHDPLAVPVLLCTSPAVLDRTEAELERQVGRLPRGAIAARSLADRGALVLVGDLEEAAGLAGDFAPEHLELQVTDPYALLPAVRNAGSVFLGPWTTEAFGDYAAGVNHVLPTGGSARFTSGLGVLDFVRRSQVLAVGPGAVETLGAVSTVLARAEGLEAHARSIEVRRGGRTAAPVSAPSPVSQTDVVNAARGVFSAWGYEDVAAPLFLPLDALEPGLKGLDLRDRILKFVDPRGRVMAVRPDWTLAIAGQSVGALKSGSAALRLSYAGSVYRLGGRGAAVTDGDDWEAAHDFQAGVELFGESAAWSDAELLAMAVESLERCGLDDFTICVGHASLAEAMLAGLGADPAAAGAMRNALVRRDLVGWERLLDSSGADPARVTAARLLAACRGVADGLETVPGDVFGPAAVASLERLRNLWSILKGSRPDWPLVFDLGLVRDLDYYTGMVFEAYAPGSGGPVLTGGRYDGLLSAFGLDRPAIGLAIEVEALTRALAAQGRMKTETAQPLRITVNAGDEATGFARAAALRRDGFRVELRGAEPRAEKRRLEPRTERRAEKRRLAGGGQR